MNGNEFGRLFRMTTYGESHGEAMGCTVSGVPAGVELSEEEIQRDLDRRKPGQSMITTSRGEPDKVKLNSGIQDGYTTGTPIGMVIQNKDARSGKVADDVTFEEMLEHTEDNEVRWCAPEKAEEMRHMADTSQKEGASIGGGIYFECRGVPRGLGAPRFDSVPSRLGQAMYSIPAVTDFELGLGREARTARGSDYTEDWEFDGDGEPVPTGNDHGGLQGGITTGDPIYGEVSWHAPVSFPKTQKTVDWETGEEKEITVTGRHDPVLPPRAVPVVEAMLYCTVLDFMLLGGRINPDRLDGRAGAYETEYHPSSPQNDPEDAGTHARTIDED